MTLTLKSITTTAQPGAPTVGDSYYIPAGATGAAWAGQDDNIGVWSEFEVWVFGTPSGEVVYVVEDEPSAADNARMVYRAADTFDHIPASDTDPGLNSLVYYDTATDRWSSFAGMNTIRSTIYTKADGSLAALSVSAGNVVGVAVGGTEIAALTGAQIGAMLGIDDLTDVTETSPLNRHLLIHNGTIWVNDAAMAGSTRMLYTTVVGAIAGLTISAGRIVGRALGGGEISALTGSQVGALIALADLSNVNTDAATVGHFEEADGTDWESVLHHPYYQGRNTTAVLNWGATEKALDLNTDDNKDAGFTHSTTTNKDQITLDAAGRYKIEYSLVFKVNTVGTASIYMNVDTGGGFVFHAPSLSRQHVGTVGTWGHISKTFFLTASAGDKIQLRIGRATAGQFDTVTNYSMVTVMKVRAA